MATTNMIYSLESIFHRDRTGGGDKQLQGFLGIRQVTCSVNRWHHLFFFMVFYL